MNAIERATTVVQAIRPCEIEGSILQNVFNAISPASNEAIEPTLPHIRQKIAEYHSIYNQAKVSVTKNNS